MALIKWLICITCVFAIAPDSDLQLLRVLSGEEEGDQFGVSVASAGDVNGDGYFDFIIGADASDAGGTCSGKTYIYFGGPSFDTVPDVVFVGEPGDFLGVSVSSAGDVNGDGYSDVIVGAHFNSDAGLRAGKALLYLGGPVMDSIPDLQFHGEREKDYFGISVAGVGDLNADGYDDFAVGAYKYDLVVGTDTIENVGRVYVYFGGPYLDTIPDLVLTGSNEGERMGYSVSGAGDINGDGYDDLITGAYSYDFSGDFNVGRAYIFFGGNPMDSIPDVVLTGKSPEEYFGWSVALAGDLNSDGFSDIVIGAYGYSEEKGRVYVYYGGSPVDTIPDYILTTSGDSVRFGYSVSGAGDVDGNGYDDLVAGADGDDAGGVDAGKVLVYVSNAGGLSIDTTLIGEGAYYYFGYSVSGAGDVNGDMNQEILIGALGAENFTGKAYLFGIPGVPTESNFIRGDVSGDLNVNVVDLVLLADYLFGAGGFAPTCLDAADLNDDGDLNCLDLTYFANFLFLGGPQIPPPYPECGADTSSDTLHCISHPCGRSFRGR